ncbi:type IV pilus assembly protein PilA [Fontibacillus panacisegetis]|uniref:Type IV pilus assembly protein PilA n=1 Tax=Fontibacillus panacisegetis TaxID=670482 RepID=A0A1G7J9N6_9BACL|nr:prepilin-type N-terminal cleavage/methylation domain-containing protein [Fontibacillus panacisegetis]SDF21593.1 type IV pilus assembly protein PilA [Fontibacillus panacisegetis]
MQMVLKRLKKEEKGFTLIELLAVIVIIAVIAVIAVPLIGNIIDNTKTKADLATARQIYEAARLHAADKTNGTLADVTLEKLQTDKFLDSPLYLPSNKQALVVATTLIDVSEETGDYLVMVTTGKTVKFTKAQIMAQ